jgi:hypothetical protein
MKQYVRLYSGMGWGGELGNHRKQQQNYHLRAQEEREKRKKKSEGRRLPFKMDLQIKIPKHIFTMKK